MDSGYYAAFSGWLARSQALDVAAGNLANAGTAGYRAERDYFRSAILGPDALDSQLNTTVNAFGVLGGSRLDLGQGALTPTGNPVDLAIEGDGFFAIQTKQGVRYTRDGQFERAQDGTLTTQAGEPVLDARDEPVRVPSGEIVVGTDGAVSYTHLDVYKRQNLAFPAVASNTILRRLAGERSRQRRDVYKRQG